MATRKQVLELIDLGHSYETAARALQIPPGLAFMIATGRPADGSVPSGEPAAAKPPLAGSPQQLVNPPPFNPNRDERVMDWVRPRARRELNRGR